MSDAQSDVQCTVQGHLGVIRLTRPKALNSLTQAMCAAIDEALVAWSTDDRVKAVLIEGEGDRAFCAGGDIRWLHDTAKADPVAATEFFRTEYRMNKRLHHYDKPIVALMDGVCMGGGVGLSQSAEFRVGTERLLWAMPEAAIGLITDVGASYTLPRLQGGLGLYLALTGARLRAADALAGGITTHHMGLASTEGLADRLVTALQENSDGDAGDVIDGVLDELSESPGDVDVLGSQDWINDTFGVADDVASILAKLTGQTHPLAEKAADAIRAGSPTSLSLIHRLLAEAPETFDACIDREFNVVFHLMASHDFIEGVRAQIIDKDRQPKWMPDSLSAVETSAIDRYFDVPPTGSLA